MTETVPCPTCRTPVPLVEDPWPPFFPFCSDRCRLIDLGRWADGSFVIPGSTTPNPDEDL